MEILNRLLPFNSPKRVGEMNPTYITIHETSLTTELQPAEKNYDRYHTMLITTENKVGFHFLVEADIGQVPRIYQFLETNVATCHTGNTVGNATSIGVERLVNVNTDMWKAISLQAQLTATLMHMFNIPLDHVVTHKSWSGKECPARLLAGMYGGWQGFIEMVKHFYNKQKWIEGVL